MNKFFYILFSIFLFCSTTINAQSATRFSQNCEAAYFSLLELNFPSLEKHLEKEKQENPENLFIPYLQHYAVFVQYYVQPKQSQQNILWGKMSSYQNQIIKNKTEDAAYWRNYFSAEIQLQQALIELNEQNYINGFFKLRSTYLFAKEVYEKAIIGHPIEKTLAVTEALFSVVPDSYQWVLRLLSIEADLSTAQAKLRKLERNPLLYFKEECLLLSAALDLHLGGNAENAYQALKESKKTPLFHSYLLANAAMHSGRNDTAIALLSGLELDAFKRFPMLFYLQGKMYLQKLDPEAEQWFKLYLNYNKGKHLIKSSLQYLAWNALIQNQLSDYDTYTNQILHKGAETGEADKAAQKAANSGIIPNSDLLKARLLFDGGYYARALAILQPENGNMSIEKTYRLGRIYHAMEKTETALFFYQKVLQKAKSSGSYLPANSAYLCGQIYLKKEDYAQAKKYFEQVFLFTEHAYKISLDQKAKAELNKIKRLE